MNQKTIFTFWEPKENMPDYLKLCIKTWEKFLPEFQIEILDYTSIENKLDRGYFDESLYHNFSIPVQTDALRCAILKKYGGLWLDVDTIITSDKIKDIFTADYDLMMINRHLCCIYAKKESPVLKKWEDEIKQRIEERKAADLNLFDKVLRTKKYQKFKNWAFLGNSILNKYIKKDKYVKCLEKKELFAFLEENCFVLSKKPTKRYVDFYFKQKFNKSVLDNNKGIICLHNSWTPKKYKIMKEKDFLKKDIMISGILKQLLNL